GVVQEKPEKRGGEFYFKFPVLWSWLRKSAEDSVQRRQIFSRVFGISFPKPAFGKSESDLREIRNAIAHGRTRIDVTTRALMQIQGYVRRTIIAIRDAVRERYKLVL